jgi:hypothetical protein
MHQEINESRERRGLKPLPGDGWSDWQAGREYVLNEKTGQLVNRFGWVKR